MWCGAVSLNNPFLPQLFLVMALYPRDRNLRHICELRKLQKCRWTCWTCLFHCFISILVQNPSKGVCVSRPFSTCMIEPIVWQNIHGFSKNSPFSSPNSSQILTPYPFNFMFFFFSKQINNKHKIDHPLWKSVWRHLTKSKLELQSVVAAPGLGMSLKESKF